MTKKDRAYAAMARAYAETTDDKRLPALARNVGYALRRPHRAGRRPEARLPAEGQAAGTHQRLHGGPPRRDRRLGRAPRRSWIAHGAAHGNPGSTGDAREVRDYLAQQRSYLRSRSRQIEGLDETQVPELPLGWWTSGPADRFGSVVYIEKEGFSELLAADQIAVRFDLAVMSNKGYSVRATRTLLAAWAKDHPDVKVLVVHDFDKQGVGMFDLIAKEIPNAIDLGLRLDDVEDSRWGLAAQAESVSYTNDPLGNLTERGANPDEIAFLRERHEPEPGKPNRWVGHRVELNAFVGGGRSSTG